MSARMDPITHTPRIPRRVEAAPIIERIVEQLRDQDQGLVKATLAEGCTGFTPLEVNVALDRAMTLGLVRREIRAGRILFLLNDELPDSAPAWAKALIESASTPSHTPAGASAPADQPTESNIGGSERGTASSRSGSSPTGPRHGLILTDVACALWSDGRLQLQAQDGSLICFAPDATRTLITYLDRLREPEVSTEAFS